MIFEVPQNLKIHAPSTEKVYEVAIVGAGPAGMTAVVYCSRKKLDTILITQNIGGQVLLTSGIENYMGYQYITGSELSDRFYTQIAQFPISLFNGVNICKIETFGKNFSLSCGEQKFFSKLVIIASGKKSKELGVPGERELVGRGVAYCSVCDAPLFKDTVTAVIGGGNSALTAVIDLLPYSTKVYLINITDTIHGDPVLLEKIKNSAKVEILLSAEVVEIKGAKRVEGIIVRDRNTRGTRQLAVGGVFVEIGLAPNSGFVKHILHLNENGEIIVDCDCRTSVDGLFACGDVTGIQGKQIIIACGEGAKAALSAYKYLLKTR